MKARLRLLRTSAALALIWLAVAGLLAWALKDVQLQLIWDSLRQLHPLEILGLAALNSLILLLMASRWWLILRALGHSIPFFQLAAYRLLAFGISYFTAGPQVGGEPAQVYLVHRRHGVPTTTAVASVSLEKILELLPNSAFLLVGALVIVQRSYLAGPASAAVLFPVVGLTFLLLGYPLLLWLGKSPVSALVQRFPIQHPTFQRVQVGVSAAESQMSEFCRCRTWTVIQTSFISALMWAGIVLEFWLMARFINLPLDPLQAMTALVFALLAFLAPLPGGLGALEASQVFALQSMGLDSSQGISLSLLIRARDITFGGAGLLLAGLLTQGEPLRLFRKKAAEKMDLNQRSAP
jgi:glycosyltransferase 2 family protein